MIGGVGGTPPFRPTGTTGSARATDAAAAAALQAAREAESRAESARALAPLLALLEAAARREDVVDLLGPSPAAALLDGLADKARAVADLALQSVPSPTPLVVQATAARLPQAVASLLADRIYEAAVAPLPTSLDTSVRVLSAGSPLVGAYLERAARYLLVSRLLSAGRSDLDALVAAIKHAASTAEAMAESDGAPEKARENSLPVPPVRERAPLRLLPRAGAELTSAPDGEAPASTTAVWNDARSAEVVEQLAEVLPSDTAVDVAFDVDGEAQQLSQATTDARAVETSETPDAEIETLRDPVGRAPTEGQAADRPRASWRALPQLVTASYHIVPVAVALEQLGDGAQWIASPAFPADADVVLGDAAASLSSPDRLALRELGDRTARVTPSLTRAVGVLHLPEPWREELLAGLAPPASRAADARLREQVRVLSALTLLREAQLSPVTADSASAHPSAPTHSPGRATSVLGELAARPLPADVRVLLDAMPLDPAMRPTISRAVRYVLATRELTRLRTADAPSLTLDGEPLPATLDALLGDDLPAIGPIGREMLRAIAAGAIAFAPVEPPTQGRPRRRPQKSDPASDPSADDVIVDAVAVDLLDDATQHGGAALLAAPLHNALPAAPRDRWPEIAAAAILLLLWLLLR
jgi:hypothetical protein